MGHCTKHSNCCGLEPEDSIAWMRLKARLVVIDAFCFWYASCWPGISCMWRLRLNKYRLFLVGYSFGWCMSIYTGCSYVHQSMMASQSHCAEIGVLHLCLRVYKDMRQDIASMTNGLCSKAMWGMLCTLLVLEIITFTQRVVCQ